MIKLKGGLYANDTLMKRKWTPFRLKYEFIEDYPSNF